jgi:type II secretory pathway pseudopilin PulG
MTENSIVLLVCTVVILAALLYAAGRRYLAAVTKVGELSAMLAQILAGNRDIEAQLEQQRRVLYDAHKRIHAVTKGLSKPLS